MGQESKTAAWYPAWCRKSETILDHSLSQLPASDKWLYVDPEPAYA